MTKESAIINNNSRNKKVSVEQLENKKKWMCYYTDDHSIVTINAEGKEVDTDLSQFIGGNSVSASTLSEVKQYAEQNSDLIEGLALESKIGLVKGQDETDIINKINDEIESRNQKLEEVAQKVSEELSVENAEKLAEYDLLLKFDDFDGDFIEFAEANDTFNWEPVLSESELRRVEYSSDSDLYRGIPDGVEITRHNGKYQQPRRTEEGVEYDEVANFVIDVNAFLESDRNESMKMDITIIPASPFDTPYDEIISTEVFNNTEKFKNEVCTGKTTTYKGSARELTDIKQLVGHQDAETKNVVDTVGLHGDEMVTPSGSVDGEWTVEDPQYIFESKEQAIETKWNLDVSDESEYDEDEVKNIIETLWKTRDTERFLPVLGYFYSSLFAPQIRDIEGELPFATVMGDTGSGKSSTLGLMYDLIGMDGNPYSARDTKYAIMNALSSTNNIPIWFDEYKPSDMAQYEINTLHDYIRKTTRKGDETRGNADQTVTTYTLQSPVIVSGEESISGSAEERRSIRTQFRSSATDENSEYANHFAKINGGSYTENGRVKYYNGYDTEAHAKAVWQFVLKYDIEDYWNDYKQSVFEILEERGISGISDLELTALTMIVAGCEIYNHIGVNHSADQSQLIPETEIEKAVEYIAESMGESNITSHLDEFVQLTAILAQENELVERSDYEDSNSDYAVVNEGESDEEIRIKLNKVYNKVSKYVMEHNLSGYDLLDSSKDYRERMRDDIPYITSTSKVTRPMGRTVAINTHDAELIIDGFERGQINPDAYIEQEEEP